MMIENSTSSKSLSSQLRLTETDTKPIIQNKVEETQTNNQQTRTKQQVQEVVQSMNKFIQPAHTSLKFEFHDKLGEYYVTIRDDVTNEVIKEVPSKKMLDIYATMAEFLGFMVDRRI